MAQRTCSIEDCERPHLARGLCRVHYDQLRRQARTPTPRPTLRQRFWTKVAWQPEGCWEWTAAVDRSTGYGRITVDGASRYAHRVSVELSGRTIPPGYEVDHVCRNRRCVNPAHLDIVTPRENQRRADVALGVRGAATHCPSGHPYDDENTYVYRGRRYCRPCKRQHWRTWNAKRRSA